MSIDSYFGLGKPDEKKEIAVKPALTDIVFEPKAMYNGKEKNFYTFDASLRVLQKRGYEHHPRPAEALDLICRGLEGRLQPEQQAIAGDMLASYGEWLSMAMILKGNMLHCYLDPKNIEFQGCEYGVKGGKLKHAGEEVYSIGPFRGWISIKEVNEINPALVEKLWSRPYAILPEEIRQHAWLFLPPENVLCPIGFFGYFNSGYIINTHCDLGNSRGVRQR